MPLEPASLIAPAVKQVPSLINILRRTPSRTFPMIFKVDSYILSNGGSRNKTIDIQFLNDSKEEHEFVSCWMELQGAKILPIKIPEKIYTGHTHIPFSTEQFPLTHEAIGNFNLKFKTQIGEKVIFSHRVRITAYGDETLPLLQRYEIRQYGAPKQRKYFF